MIEYTDNIFGWLYKLLRNKDIIKVYEEEKSIIKDNTCQIKSYLFKIVKRRQKNGYWIEEEIPLNKIYFEKKVNVPIKWTGNKHNIYDWNEYEYIKWIFQIVNYISLEQEKEIYIVKCNRIEYMETVLCDNLNAEYRRYKSITVIFNIGNNQENAAFVIDKEYSYEDLKKKLEEFLNKEFFFQFLQTKSVNCLDNKIVFGMSTDAANGFIHEVFGHLLEGDIFVRQNIFHKNDKVGNKYVNIKDVAYDSDAPLSYYIDDEGSKCKDIELIKNGIICKIMSDKELCKNGNEYMVGGNVRGSINGEFSTIRMKNLMLENGDYTRNQIVDNIDEGIWIEKFEDSYCIGNIVYLYIRRAFKIEFGKICGKVTNIKIVAERKKMMQGIDMIGDDGKWGNIVECKKQGKIYISAYSPSIRCSLNINDIIWPII